MRMANETIYINTQPETMYTAIIEATELSNLNEISVSSVSYRLLVRLLLPTKTIFLASVNHKLIPRARIVCQPVQLVSGQKYG
jgi:hypothetical protein